MLKNILDQTEHALFFFYFNINFKNIFHMHLLSLQHCFKSLQTFVVVSTMEHGPEYLDAKKT